MILEERLKSIGDKLSNGNFEYLNGGRESSIKRDGKTVHRPAQKWTPLVHKFLNSLRENGFHSAPIPLEINLNNEEVVSYLEGDVYNEELPTFLQTDETLLSVAKLIKDFHRASISFLDSLTGDEPWMLISRTPVEVMCHGDFAPYNVVITDTMASGIIDFDTIHPGPRIWDIAYAVYRWVPLMSPENPESYGSKTEQLRRLKLFLNEYGEFNKNIRAVLETVIERLRYTVQFMEEKANAGDINFQKNIEAGHHLGYFRDIMYVHGLIKSLA